MAKQIETITIEEVQLQLLYYMMCKSKSYSYTIVHSRKAFFGLVQNIRMTSLTKTTGLDFLSFSLFFLSSKQKCDFSEWASVSRNSYRNNVLFSEHILEWGLNLEQTDYGYTENDYVLFLKEKR